MKKQPPDGLSHRAGWQAIPGQSHTKPHLSTPSTAPNRICNRRRFFARQCPLVYLTRHSPSGPPFPPRGITPRYGAHVTTPLSPFDCRLSCPALRVQSPKRRIRRRLAMVQLLSLMAKATWRTLHRRPRIRPLVRNKMWKRGGLAVTRSSKSTETPRYLVSCCRTISQTSVALWCRFVASSGFRNCWGRAALV